MPQGDRPFSFVVYSSEIRDFGIVSDQGLDAHILDCIRYTVVLVVDTDKAHIVYPSTFLSNSKSTGLVNLLQVVALQFKTLFWRS